MDPSQELPSVIEPMCACAHRSERQETSSNESMRANKESKEREVTDQELEDLHWAHSFKSKLILEAICRKLQYLRQDRDLSSETSIPQDTTEHESVFLKELEEEQGILDQIATRFYSQDTTSLASLNSPEFYIGFWDAWTSIRDIGTKRLVDRLYLDGVNVIENARLDLYFPNRLAPCSLCSTKTANQADSHLELEESLSQTDLYFPGTILPDEFYEIESAPEHTRATCSWNHIFTSEN